MNDNRLRILFYHADTGKGTNIWLYPTVLILKTYIDIQHPETAKKLEWCIPIQQLITDEELIEQINKTNPDVLCTSHYLWNHEPLVQQLQRVLPQLNKKIKVVAGGPSITVHIDPEFFQKYPFIDYAVYGSGECAFADIITSLVNNRSMIVFNTSNCAWKGFPQHRLAEYKPVKLIPTSPFIQNKQLMIEMVKDSRDKGLVFNFPYSLTRGCPYSCTFCDWNSGLSNKVSRRKATYQQEIDLFQELGITEIYLADANIGQYDEDIDMIQYFAKKNIEENAGFHIAGNYSKLRKDANLKIFNFLAQGQLIRKTFNFAVQDTNETVLQNIDRPDVGWAVHAAMIDELHEKYPQYYSKIQMIYGLPGQTVESWRETLRTVTQKRLVTRIFFNEPLPASPALTDPEYQRKFQFEYVNSNRRSAGVGDYSTMIPKKCISFSQYDLVEMTVLSTLYTALSTMKTIVSFQENIDLDLEPVVDSIVHGLYYKSFCNNLYENWTTENNFYYSIDFFGDPEYFTTDSLFLGYKWAKDKNFVFLVAMSLPVDQAKKLISLYLTPTYANEVEEYMQDID